MNKELHSTYAYVDFRQLSLVVPPDLLVARHFPPRVCEEEPALSSPRLWCVSGNKSRQQFRRRRWECLQSAQASSASDPSALHTALRFTSAENVFQACEPASLLAGFCRGGSTLQNLCPPTLQALLPHPPLYLLLLLADRPPSQILVQRIHLINTFVFQLLMAIRQLSVSSVLTFLCVFLCFAALSVWMSDFFFFCPLRQCKNIIHIQLFQPPAPWKRKN